MSNLSHTTLTTYQTLTYFFKIIVYLLYTLLKIYIVKMGFTEYKTETLCFSWSFMRSNLNPQNVRTSTRWSNLKGALIPNRIPYLSHALCALLLRRYILILKKGSVDGLVQMDDIHSTKSDAFLKIVTIQAGPSVTLWVLICFPAVDLASGEFKRV